MRVISLLMISLFTSVYLDQSIYISLFTTVGGSLSNTGYGGNFAATRLTVQELTVQELTVQELTVQEFTVANLVYCNPFPL